MRYEDGVNMIKMWYLDDKLYHIGGPAFDYNDCKKWWLKHVKKKTKQFEGLDKKLFEL